MDGFCMGIKSCTMIQITRNYLDIVISFLCKKSSCYSIRILNVEFVLHWFCNCFRKNERRQKYEKKNIGRNARSDRSGI